jgi:hypothetical protein
MYSIWKYPVPISDLFTILMPTGSRLLSVQVQGSEPQLWALVDPEAPIVRRALRVHGTGHDVATDIGAYVGTFQMRMGTLVFHLFDQGETPSPETREGPQG